jgi:hypothetical protein
LRQLSGSVVKVFALDEHPIVPTATDLADDPFVPVAIHVDGRAPIAFGATLR